MPHKNPNHKTRHQRQQRRAGHVRRVEFVLNADSERDQAIHDFLTNLPHGEVGEFIRSAILEKINRQAAPVPEAPSAAEQFNTILAELAELRKAVSQPPIPVQPPAASEPTASSGLDMSSPRRKRDPLSEPGPRRQTPPEEKPFDEAEARRILVQSIHAFGQNRAGNR